MTALVLQRLDLVVKQRTEQIVYPFQFNETPLINDSYVGTFRFVAGTVTLRVASDLGLLKIWELLTWVTSEKKKWT